MLPGLNVFKTSSISEIVDEYHANHDESDALTVSYCSSSISICSAVDSAASRYIVLAMLDVSEMRADVSFIEADAAEAKRQSDAAEAKRQSDAAEANRKAAEQLEADRLAAEQEAAKIPA